MSQIAAISIDDGKTTPVSHTFTPSLKDGRLVQYVDLSVDAPIGRPVIRLSLVPPSGNGKMKAKVQVSVPELKLASDSQTSGFVPAPEVAGRVTAYLEFSIDENVRSSTIADALAFAANVMNDTQVVDLIKNGSLPY